MIAYSVLDLAHVCQGATITQTFEKCVLSAQKAEACGYTRYWFAEHHNMKSVASSATSVLIGHIAANTSRIRVGSGGVMLPNHSPLVIAEQFGTLASLFVDRIDLGLGRAPGTDQLTAQALNRNFFENAQSFPHQLMQLQRYFSAENANSMVRAFPGEGIDVPVWILGSSTDSAYLSSSMGLPYAFASHFAPGQLLNALQIYHENFRSTHTRPYTMACVNVILADTIEKANQLATSFYRMFLGIIRNEREYMQPPIDSMDGLWNVNEMAHVKQMTAYSFIGTKETVKRELSRFIELTAIDELMINIPVYHLEDKIYTLETLAQIMQELS